MNEHLTEVREHIQAYLEKHMPEYEVLEVRKKSVFEEDSFLYMVSARKTDGTYAVWTGWNETTRSLNHGHYDLQRLEQCEQIFKKYFNNGKW